MLVTILAVLLGGFVGIPASIGLAMETQEWRSTGTGTHVGIVTAVERTGSFWQTWTVYLKTNAETTQEENYCVRPGNANLIPALQDASRGRYLVELQYEGYWNVDMAECNPGQAAVLSLSRV